MELKPEHHNPAFYDNTNASHEVADDDDDDDADADDYDDDSNSLLSNQSTSHQMDVSGIVQNSGTASSSSLLMNPAAVAAVSANSGNENKVRKTKKSNSVKKSIKTQSPAPPIATRKATSYIGVSGS